MSQDLLVEQLRVQPPATARQLAKLTGRGLKLTQDDLSRFKRFDLVEVARTEAVPCGRPANLWTLTEKGRWSDAVFPRQTVTRIRVRKPKPKPPERVFAPLVVVQPTEVKATLVQRALLAQPDLATVWNDRRAA